MINNGVQGTIFLWCGENKFDFISVVVQLTKGLTILSSITKKLVCAEEAIARYVPAPPNLRESKLWQIGKEVLTGILCFPFNHLWDACVVGRLAWTFEKTNPDTNKGVLSLGDVILGHRGMGR